ncbi:MAG: immunoglobulin domain-containing protein [Verrucomicrobiales bacterium]|nr:immunoglobulin domain-containing protein [Verrucomicrobiales bacterium]
MIGLIAGAPRAWGAVFQDTFATREFLEGEAGDLLGTNTGATREEGEPRHARKSGGHSVWVSWVAPSDGLLSLSTAGSDFDTILAVYRRETPGPDTSFAGLDSVGDDDDDDDDVTGSGSSVAHVAVRSGVRYEIAIDGYSGATGTIRLSWTFFSRTSPLPVISGGTADQSVREGDPISLSFNLGRIEGAEYRWQRNGREVDGAESPVLNIEHFRPEHAGQYRLKIKFADITLTSQAIELQINTEGQTQVLARNKLFDAVESGLRLEHHEGAPAALSSSRPALRTQSIPIGVIRGQNGTQVFNTRYATRDPKEPAHCGIVGGASYWFGYECTEDGLLHFDSTGSEIDTILAVYTFDPPLTGYDQLQPVACNVSGGPTAPASIVDFPANQGRTYLIVLEGVANARGTARIHYRWNANTNAAVLPPSIQQSPASNTVAAGQPIELSATVAGTEPLSYFWHKDDTILQDAKGPRLLIPTSQLQDAGRYWLEVTNAAGSAISDVAQVDVWAATRLTLEPAAPVVARNSSVTLALAIEGSTPAFFTWLHEGQVLTNATATSLVLPQVNRTEQGRYSVRSTTPLGEVASNEILLQVLEPPVIESTATEQSVGEGVPITWNLNVRGDQPLAFQWLKDGVPLPHATNRVLTLPSVTFESAGHYVLVVVNPVGTASSSEQLLTVIGPPVLQNPPTPLTVGVGGRARFRAEGAFGPTPQFRWWRNGFPCPNGNNAEMVLEPVEPAMAGDYIIEISNALGSVRSSPARLTVIATSGFRLNRATSDIEFWFIVAPNRPYKLETTDSMNQPWTLAVEGMADETALIWWRKNTTDARQWFLRCHSAANFNLNSAR